MARTTITRNVSISSASSTTLATIRAGLSARSYAQLPVTWPGGSSSFWLVPGATENILTYTNAGTWDPTSRKMLFLGCGYVQSRLVQYDEATNTWSKSDPNPPGNIIHAWDHNAIDTERGHFYASNQNGSGYWKYIISTGTWSSVAGNAVSETHGVTWFPEADSLISVPPSSGQIKALAAGAGSWTNFATTSYATNYHGFAEYDPIRGVVYFGGGSNNSSALYKLTSAGVVTQLASAPAGVMDLGGSSGGNTCCDPVTGHLIVRARPSGTMYAYNPDTNAWSTITTTGGSFLEGKSMCMCVPISTHGVIMYIGTSDGPGNNTVCGIYRHT